jgi:short-subunit dehydrogenase
VARRALGDAVSDFASRYGPWAIVAGASDGTGAAFAEELAARGLNVVLVARRRALLEAVAGRLPTETLVVVQDLSAPDAGEVLAGATADLDVGSIVFNAGADEHIVPFVDQPLEDLYALVRRNCVTVLDVCHRLGRRLLARGRGGVVIVSSGAAWVGSANIAVYGATKAFDLVLAEALWAEWREHGVDVLSLVMGATDTPTMQRVLAARGGTMELARAEDVAREALDHLGDGPTWATGMPDPQGGSPFGALPRRQAVELMTQATAAVHPPGASG